MAVQESSIGCRLTSAEFETLRRHCYDIVTTIRPFLVAQSLTTAGYLPATVLTTLHHMAADGQTDVEIGQCLICHLPFYCQLQDFITSLHACGYYGLASKLNQTFITLCTLANTVQRSSSAQHRPKHLQFIEYYLNLVHTDKVLDPLQTFHGLAQYNEVRMSETTDVVKKQAFADRTVAMKCGELYMLTITGKHSVIDSPLFDEIRDLLPQTTDTSYTEALFGVRHTHALCVMGKLDAAEARLNQATYQTAFVSVDLLVIYMWVYLHLLKFEQQPTTDNRETVLRWAEKGMTILGSGGSDSYWRPMLLLKMVYCFLGLGTQSNIITACPIQEADEQRASDLLNQTQAYYSQMSGRRKMLYHIARARLCQLAYDYETCLKFLEKAMKLAQKEEFLEVAVIAGYQRAVSDLITRERSTDNLARHSQQHSLLDSQSSVPASRRTQVVNSDENYHDQQPTTNTDPSSDSSTLDTALQNAVHMKSMTNAELSQVMFDEANPESTGLSNTDLKELKHNHCGEHSEETYLKQTFGTPVPETESCNKRPQLSDEQTYMKYFALGQTALTNVDGTDTEGSTCHPADTCIQDRNPVRPTPETTSTETTNVEDIRGELYSHGIDQSQNSTTEEMAGLYCQETGHFGQIMAETDHQCLSMNQANTELRQTNIEPRQESRANCNIEFTESTNTDEELTSLRQEAECIALNTSRQNLQ